MLLREQTYHCVIVNATLLSFDHTCIMLTYNINIVLYNIFNIDKMQTKHRQICKCACNVSAENNDEWSQAPQSICVMCLL